MKQAENNFQAQEAMSGSKPTLSVIIITKNEEKNIARCLNSIVWADEIIVVDSGSSDRTEEICREYPQVRFSYNPWAGFGPQKKRALELASSEWALSLDSDEVIPPELSEEIREIIASQTACDGYKIQRKNFYRDQWIRHCGWWPEWKLRLFKRNRGSITDCLVHESVKVEGSIGRLRCPFEHYSFASIFDFVVKSNTYSDFGAKQMLSKGRRTSTAEAFFRAVWTFFRVYFLKRGFLDGRAGLIIAFSNMTGVFYRYIKLLELQQDAKK